VFVKYVMRKACSKSKVDVAVLKSEFLLEIQNIICMDSIPPQLVINFDQTALNYQIGQWKRKGQNKLE